MYCRLNPDKHPLRAMLPHNTQVYRVSPREHANADGTTITADSDILSLLIFSGATITLNLARPNYYGEPNFRGKRNTYIYLIGITQPIYYRELRLRMHEFSNYSGRRKLSLSLFYRFRGHASPEESRFWWMPRRWRGSVSLSKSPRVKSAQGRASASELELASQPVWTI